MGTRVSTGPPVNPGHNPVGQQPGVRTGQGPGGPTQSHGQGVGQEQGQGPGVGRGGPPPEPPGHGHQVSSPRSGQSAQAGQLTSQTAPLASRLQSSFNNSSNRPDISPSVRGQANGIANGIANGLGLRDAPGQALGNSFQKSSAAIDYLRGTVPGTQLPAEVRGALDQMLGIMGRDAINQLLDQPGHHYEKLFDRLLQQASRAFDETGSRINEQTHHFQRALDEIVGIGQLGKHFEQLEKIGGEPVRRAEESVLRLLYNVHAGEDGGGHGLDKGVLRLSAWELLRDLRSGAFFPAQEALSPFPLTGRARVVNEMIELMHTLDALERALQQLQNQKGQGGPGGQSAAAVTGEQAGLMTEEELLQWLGLLQQGSLPGRAARGELVSLFARLQGELTDAQGKALLTKDGVPLKLDQLLWLGQAGGLLGGMFKADSFPVHLSPLLLYGFDAIYSLIGFDGRTLFPVHYAAVQAQVNGSEMEWVFGQPPLTEGWMRALIERLKDSATPDHNLLGEMLEEALLDGRFHTVLVQGSATEGEAVPGSFHVKRLLPGPAAEQAFAPA